MTHTIWTWTRQNKCVTIIEDGIFTLGKTIGKRVYKNAFVKTKTEENVVLYESVVKAMPDTGHLQDNYEIRH